MFRQYILDDTFIHLRYARNYAATGYFFYNYDQPSFGTSAPLYTILLATIGNFVPLSSWPDMAKYVSIAAHLFSIILFLNVTFASIDVRKGSALGTYIGGFLITVFMLAVPSTSRWLQDGMETSIAVCCTLGAIVATRQCSINQNQKSLSKILLPAFICALVGVLRIDLLPISISTLILVILRNHCHKVRLFAYTVAFLIIGYATIFYLTGSVMPDSAIAKRTGMFTPGWVVDFFKAMLAVSPLWIVTPALIIVSLIHNNISKATLFRRNIQLLLGLFPISATIIWGTATGQFVHGARYFLPALIFAWAVLLSCEQDLIAWSNTSRWSQLRITILVLGLVAAIVHAGIIWRPLSLVRQKDSLQLAQLTDRTNMIVAAHDVGQIGWYTSARILDLAGLVNGNVVARTPYPERLCVAIKTMGYPDAFALTDAQSQAWRKGNILQLACTPGDTITYIKTAVPIMRHYDLDQVREWQLWVKEVN
jgi:hypothetical protein